MNDSSGISFGAPPEYYSDSVRMAVNPYGFIFSFGLASENPGDAQTQAVVRMSPQHVKVLYQIMKNNLRAYEKEVGAINLPDGLYQELGIEKEV